MIEPTTPLRQECDKCSLTRMAQRMFEPIQLTTVVPVSAVSEGGRQTVLIRKTAARIRSATGRCLHLTFPKGDEGDHQVTTRYC
jgi:hypothetical protein